MIRYTMVTAWMILSASIAAGQSISFGVSDHTFEIEFVEIGSVGNLPDTRPVSFGPREIGSVGYAYGISKFELPCSSIDAAGNLGAFPEFGGTNCTSHGQSYPGTLSPDEAVDFVNWLNTSHGYQPAYNMISWSELAWSPGDLGYNPENPVRNSLARFFLPNGDEFHKSAYYDPVNESWFDYATGGNEEPSLVSSGNAPNTLVAGRVTVFDDLPDVHQAGGESAFGTVGQVGNAPEWEERGEDASIPNDFWWSSVGVSAPRYSYFDSRRNGRVSGAMGFRVVDLGEIPAGDFNGDRVFTPRDIDELVDAINSPEPSDFYDLNGDGSVNADDRTFWIEELANVTYGDADMNGEVDFEDFLALSALFEMDGGWSGGDFDGSGLTDFEDFLTLSGNFGQAESTAVASVPEPSSVSLASLSLLALGVLLRRKR